MDQRYSRKSNCKHKKIRVRVLSCKFREDRDSLQGQDVHFHHLPVTRSCNDTSEAGNVDRDVKHARLSEQLMRHINRTIYPALLHSYVIVFQLSHWLRTASGMLFVRWPMANRWDVPKALAEVNAARFIDRTPPRWIRRSALTQTRETDLCDRLDFVPDVSR